MPQAGPPEDEWADSAVNTATVEVVTGTALESLTRAEVDMQIATAKRYPRDLAKFAKELLALATASREIAETMFYRLERKDSDGTKKAITGPSIRLAEAAAACYGNIRHGSRVIDVGQKTVTAQGVCHDLERNNFTSTEIVRRITTKTGRRFSEDMVVVTCNAAQSLARRNAIKGIVPLPIIMTSCNAAMRLVAGVPEDELPKRRASAVKWFAGKGIPEERLLALLELRTRDEITGEHIATLVGWKNGLEAEEFTVADLLNDAVEATTSEPTGPITVESMSAPAAVSTQTPGAASIPVASASASATTTEPPDVDALLEQALVPPAAGSGPAPATPSAAPKPASAAATKPPKGAGLFDPKNRKN